MTQPNPADRPATGPEPTEDIAGDLWYQKEGWLATGEDAAPRTEAGPHLHSTVGELIACHTRTHERAAQGAAAPPDPPEVRRGLLEAAGHLARFGCNVYHDEPCRWNRLSGASTDSTEEPDADEA